MNLNAIRSYLARFAIVGMAATSVGGSVALADLRFSVHNRSDSWASALYIFPRGADTYGPNLLASGQLQPGGTRQIILNYPNCDFDIVAEWNNHAPSTARGINLCGVTVVPINP